MWWIFSRLWAPFMAISWPLVILYGAMAPREADVAAIRRIAHGVPLLVGQAWGGTDCRSNEPCTVIAPQRSYLVFPGVLTNAAVIIVEDKTGGATVTEMPGYALLVLLVWVVCCYGTWHFWIGPFVTASNNRIERTRER